MMTEQQRAAQHPGRRGRVTQRDERGIGPFDGTPYHICGKTFTEDDEEFECTDHHGHEGPCNQ